jgi:hypothetical protein
VFVIVELLNNTEHLARALHFLVPQPLKKAAEAKASAAFFNGWDKKMKRATFRTLTRVPWPADSIASVFIGGRGHTRTVTFMAIQ